MRRTGIAAAVVLAVIVVAVGGTAFYVLTRLDSLVQTAIEEFGSSATGVKVSLGSVEIDPADGRGRLNDLRVANPPGFAAEDALSIAQTSLAIDLSSLTGDTIVIHDVSVRNPRFRYVIGPDGGNIDRIIENVRKTGAAADPAPDGGGGGDSGSGDSGRRFVVERLSIQGAEVSVSAAQLGPKGMTVALPTLELRDLGTAGDGLTPEALLGAIVARLEESANAEFAKIPSLQGILTAPIMAAQLPAGAKGATDVTCNAETDLYDRAPACRAQGRRGRLGRARRRRARTGFGRFQRRADGRNPGIAR